MYRWGHHDGFASSMGHPRLDSVGLVVYDGMGQFLRAPVLYYGSVGTTPTLPRRV
jgi:hypothetical protein